MNLSVENQKPHQGLFLRCIAPMLLILIFVSASCTPPPPTPVPPGPPPNTNGQAILGWGKNSSGQLGDGSTVQRLTPSLVPLKNIQAIAAGGDYSLALTSDGHVLEFGGNQRTPTAVAALSSIKQIAVGDGHRLALRADGTVWAWGENNHGQLGDGSTTARSAPVQVAGLNHISGIAAGGDHSLAIGSGFSVWSWGSNSSGQVGNGTQTDQLTPVVLPGLQVIEVAASSSHSVALTTDLKVMGWGTNTECQLGIDPRDDIFDPIVCSDHTRPAVVYETPMSPYPSGNGYAIAAANGMTLVVLSDGRVVGFGGTGDPDYNMSRGMCNPEVRIGGANVPILVPIKEVVASADHALLLTRTGEIWSLGANIAGQGGLGTTSLVECPQAVSSMTVRGVSQLAAGKEHSLALIKGTLLLSPATWDFGNQRVGTNSSFKNVTITNTGLAPITFYTITKTGDYSLTEDCPNSPRVLAAGASCTLRVRFKPTTTGKRDGKIQLTDDAQGNPQEIPLTGNGT